MRPKFFTVRNFLLLILAGAILGGLVRWAMLGFPLLGDGVPSTAGKLAFTSTRDGSTDIYLALPTESASAERLTKDDAVESELSFSPDGDKLSFTAERNNVRQLSIMDAAAGRRVFDLTKTSSTKETPTFAPDRTIFFLDAGKIASTSVEATDSHAIFPTVEEKHENEVLAKIFDEGGITQFAVSPDKNRLYAVVKRETSQILVVYDEESKATALLGAAAKIRVQVLADGTLYALFCGGGPIKPVQLPEPKSEAEKEDVVRVVSEFLSVTARSVDAQEKSFALVSYDKDLNAKPALPPLPQIDGFRVAPDGKQVALFAEEAREGTLVGLFVGNLGDTSEQPKRLYDRPCHNVSWSPDSQKLAFAAEDNVWVVGITEGTPINISGGKGTSDSPVWSPAVAPAKK